ncbi:hypothetical protein LCGC14_2930550 [marine sediment metagenome]|uniref:Uncharacterized protein n=1 Tax=marine sediment metagenome TaxID=412755 RepID=A0A0F8XLF2_9ZZZZ
MLKVDSLHRRLSIVMDSDWNFYTPTTPEGYCEGRAMADVMSGKNSYSFQRLGVREKSFCLWWSNWVAGNELLQFDDFPERWKIIEGRPWNTPKRVTPEQAEHFRTFGPAGAGRG